MTSIGCSWYRLQGDLCIYPVCVPVLKCDSFLILHPCISYFFVFVEPVILLMLQPERLVSVCITMCFHVLGNKLYIYIICITSNEIANTINSRYNQHHTNYLWAPIDVIVMIDIIVFIFIVINVLPGGKSLHECINTAALPYWKVSMSHSTNSFVFYRSWNYVNCSTTPVFIYNRGFGLEN